VGCFSFPTATSGAHSYFASHALAMLGDYLASHAFASISAFFSSPALASFLAQSFFIASPALSSLAVQSFFIASPALASFSTKSGFSPDVARRITVMPRHGTPGLGLIAKINCHVLRVR